MKSLSLSLPFCFLIYKYGFLKSGQENIKHLQTLKAAWSWTDSALIRTEPVWRETGQRLCVTRSSLGKSFPLTFKIEKPLLSFLIFMSCWHALTCEELPAEGFQAETRTREGDMFINECKLFRLKILLMTLVRDSNETAWALCVLQLHSSRGRCSF